MIGGIRFEHTHRLIAGTVGILTLVFMLCLFRREKRAWVRWLGVLAFLAVVAQAVLGGLTVLYLLPTAVSVSHACLAQTFFTLIATLAYVTSAEWLRAERQVFKEPDSARRLALITAVFSYCQLVAGAILRHTHGRMLALHLVLAFLILLHILLINLKISKNDALRQKLSFHALLLGVFVLTQISLGFASYVCKYLQVQPQAPRWGTVLLITAHQSLGALILAGTVLLVLRCYRLFSS